MKELYQPPGRKDGQPIVEVKDATITILGEPTVNYDELDNLFRKEFTISEAVTPKVTLYGSQTLGLLDGYHIPYTKTVNINAARCIAKGGQDRLTKSLLHQAEHLSASVNSPLETAINLSMYPVTASSIGAVIHTEIDELAKYIPESFSIVRGFVELASPIAGAIAGDILWHKKVDEFEEGAKVTAEKPHLRERYRDVISFEPKGKPKSV